MQHGVLLPKGLVYVCVLTFLLKTWNWRTEDFRSFDMERLLMLLDSPPNGLPTHTVDLGDTCKSFPRCMTIPHMFFHSPFVHNNLSHLNRPFALSPVAFKSVIGLFEDDDISLVVVFDV